MEWIPSSVCPIRVTGKYIKTKKRTTEKRLLKFSNLFGKTLILGFGLQIQF